MCKTALSTVQLAALQFTAWCMFSMWQDKHTIPQDPPLAPLPTAAHQQHFLGGTEPELAVTWSDSSAS